MNGKATVDEATASKMGLSAAEDERLALSLHVAIWSGVCQR